MPINCKFEKLSKEVMKKLEEFEKEDDWFAREIETGGIVGYRRMMTCNVE